MVVVLGLVKLNGQGNMIACDLIAADTQKGAGGGGGGGGRGGRGGGRNLSGAPPPGKGGGGRRPHGGHQGRGKRGRT